MSIEADVVRIRRAGLDDVDFFVRLVSHEEVEPFLSVTRARNREGVREEIERSRSSPREFGRFVIEAMLDDSWMRAGIMGFEVANRRSRIAQLGGLAIEPELRGQRVADTAARLLQHLLLGELGYHRLQLECYGFNERAIRHAERSGFIREGVKRKAYWRHGEWVDGVLYGLLAEDLERGTFSEG